MFTKYQIFHTRFTGFGWRNPDNKKGGDIDVARDARNLPGGGITTEYCPMRHMLNLESVNTYEGTEIFHQLVFGQEIAGFEAF